LYVHVNLEHPLAVGELLATTADDSDRRAHFRLEEFSPANIVGVVGAIIDDARMPVTSDGSHADLVVPATAIAGRTLGPGATLLVGKAAVSGTQAFRARAVGEPYSLITQQPLGGKWGGGQAVSIAQVEWLLSREMRANIGELASLKSDDARNRSRLEVCHRDGKLNFEEIPAAGMPETFNVLRSELLAMGLAVTLDDAHGAVAMTLRPALDEEIVASSNGKIDRPETMDFRTFREIPRGLFCPKVFGGDGQTRRHRWGHIQLSAPVVSPLWRIGSPSILESLLGWTDEQIEGLLKNEVWVRQVDGVWQTAEESQAETLTGALAMEALLSAVPAERVPPGLRGRVQTLVLRVVPVLPPDFRPLVLLDSGNFATADVNDLYRQLINRNNRLAKLEELKAPAVILWNERRMLQQCTDALWANCLLPRRKQELRSTGEPLKDFLELVASRLLDDVAKRVEWCAGARAVALPDVPDRKILVPQAAYATLLLDTEQPVLVTAPEGGGSFIALLPEPHEFPMVAMSPAAYQRLGLDGRARHTCVVHRPLGTAACAEARRLLEGDPGPLTQPDTRADRESSWTDATEFNELIRGLVQAALTEQRVVLDSPRGMLLAGTGCVEPTPDSDVPIKKAPTMEVPNPFVNPPTN
jgi:hypothetical protein